MGKIAANSINVIYYFILKASCSTSSTFKCPICCFDINNAFKERHLLACVEIFSFALNDHGCNDQSHDEATFAKKRKFATIKHEPIIVDDVIPPPAATSVPAVASNTASVVPALSPPLPVASANVLASLPNIGIVPASSSRIAVPGVPPSFQLSKQRTCSYCTSSSISKYDMFISVHGAAGKLILVQCTPAHLKSKNAANALKVTLDTFELAPSVQALHKCGMCNKPSMDLIKTYPRDGESVAVCFCTSKCLNDWLQTQKVESWKTFVKTNMK